MISKTTVNRIRAAFWYAIDVYRKHGATSMLAKAEAALLDAHLEPTIQEAAKMLRVAASMARKASSLQKKSSAVTCMTGHRILQDLNLAFESIEKAREQSKRRNRSDS